MAPEPGHRLDDRVERLAAVELAAVVAVAADREQHLGLDLREAVDHAARAEVRRAGRPHGAERRGGEERGRRLGDVRHVGDDAVAALDAQRAQAGGDPRDLVAQVAPGDLGVVAVLAARDDRERRVVLVAEHVLGVVDERAREPLRAGHLPRGQHGRTALADAVAIPDRGPEPLEVLDRPAPQLVVAVEPALAPVGAERGALQQRVGRRPEHRRRHRSSQSRIRRTTRHPRVIGGYRIMPSECCAR